MSDDAPPVAEGRLPPEEVEDRSFPMAFRGFDPVEVRAFLGVVADELRRLQGQASTDGPGAEHLIAESADAGEQLATARAEADEMLGVARAEADRLVREARDRVAVLGSAATAEATRLLDDARAQAGRIRATAVDDLRGRAEEAEGAIVRKLAEAEREAASIRVRAREEADQLIEAARQRGREMVAEAQAARDRMLADLTKRKRAAQSQLEQLKAGRDRLLDTLRVARRGIDELTSRFEGQDGGSLSSATPASVTSTPGAPASQAQARAASSAALPGSRGTGEGEAPRGGPSRTRSMAIGEPPVPAARPQIAAPQARAVPEPPEPPPSEAPSPPPATRKEERRSSSLRILRRNRQPERSPVEPPPHAVGRDSPAEGVRIIRDAGGGGQDPQPGPEAGDNPPDSTSIRRGAESAPPSAVVPAAKFQSDEETLPGGQPAPEDRTAREVDPPEMVLPGPADFTPAAERGPGVTAFDLGPNVDFDADPDGGGETPVSTTAGVVEHPEPLAREDIRPRIESLFARIRADREEAVARAREVLAASPSAPVNGEAAASRVEVADPEGRAVSSGHDPEPNRASRAGPVEPRVEQSDSPERVTDRDEHWMQARDRIIEPLVGQLTRRLKRALQDEQNASLDRLRTSRGRGRSEIVLSSPDDQATPYRQLATTFLGQASRAGAAEAPPGRQGVSVDDLARQLAADLAGALRSRVDRVLNSAADEDLDLPELSERISAVYRDWKTQKLERLAIHYLLAAHERGRFLAHPEGAPLRWIVDDEAPCPDCDDNALAGPTPRGAQFPTGQLHPPAHLGCRCLLVPAST